VTAQIVVLAYGGVVHVFQLATGGWPPYSWAPTWLAVYFTSLTLLDPLAATLLWTRRLAGLHLSIAVLATDAAANGWAASALPGVPTTARIGQVIVSVLAVTAMITFSRVRPWLRKR
jgi:hypothetical protein